MVLSTNRLSSEAREVERGGTSYRILPNVKRAGSHRFLLALLVPRLAAVSVFTLAAPRLVPDEPFFLYLPNPLPLSCKAH
jgi:hypothetical protein